MMKSYDEAFQSLDLVFRKILEPIPKAALPRLPNDWLHWQILERFTIWNYADIHDWNDALEIDRGPHATAAIALAALAGDDRKVIAVDLGRWKGFREN